MRTEPGGTHQSRRLEAAQLVWRHALGLAQPGMPRESPTAMLGLLRVARHDPSTLRHALSHGRRLKRSAAAPDRATALAVHWLQRAMVWTGPRS
jgi:hypothetical protein